MKNKVIALILTATMLVQPVSVLAANENLFTPDETITNITTDENGYLVTPFGTRGEQYVDTRLKRYMMDEGPQYQCYVTYYYEDYWTCLSNTMQLLLDEDHTMTFPLPARPCSTVEGATTEELLKVDYEDSLVCQGQLDIVENCTDFVVTINNDGTYTVSLIVADLPVFDNSIDASHAGFGNTVFSNYLTRESCITDPGLNNKLSLGNLQLIIDTAEKEIADANLTEDMTNGEKATALFFSMINNGYCYYEDDDDYNLEASAAGVAARHYGVCDGLNQFFAFTCQLAGIPVFTVDVMQPTFTASRDSNDQHLTTVLWTPGGMIPYDFSDGCGLANYFYEGTIHKDSFYTDEQIEDLCIGDNYDWHDYNGVVYPAKDEEHAIMFSCEF